MSDCGCHMEANNEQERKTLRTVLAINLVMFFVEFGLGMYAQSAGLVADSLDMFADASVYAISLYAVGRAVAYQKNLAKLSGYIQMTLAVFVFVQVIVRFIYGSEPLSALIIIVGGAALVANVIVLKMIAQHKGGGVHMEASYIFSKNDVIANAGVILAGVLVWALGSHYPDLIIGLIISAIVFRGGLQILKKAE